MANKPMTYREKMINALETVPVHDGVIRMSEEVRGKIVELLKEQPQWISVEDRLPAETHSIFWPWFGRKEWNNSMWREQSDKVIVTVVFDDGTRYVTTGETHDGKWNTTISKTIKHTVTHWMPLPEPPKEELDD